MSILDRPAMDPFGADTQEESRQLDVSSELNDIEVSIRKIKSVY